MIRIIDYGLGNISAFLNVFRRLNVEAGVARTEEDLRDASKLVLPGVGAFDRAMDLLVRSGMRDALDELALRKRVPVLGICVGMQVLGRTSEEGRSPGLGWIDGHVRSLRSLKEGMMLPHMGWNDVRPSRPMKLFHQLEADARFYFLHSYYFECGRPEHVAAVSSYGADFSCAINAENIYGVQFHPEKSHHFGTQLLKNFSEL